MRYPLDDLAQAAGIQLGQPHHHTRHVGETDPDTELVGRALLAARLGVSRRTLERASIHGCTDAQADRWAIALNRHPADIWGTTWWDGATPDDPKYSDDPTLADLDHQHAALAAS